MNINMCLKHNRRDPVFPTAFKKTGAVICSAFHAIGQQEKQKPLEGASEALEAVSNIKC